MRLVEVTEAGNRLVVMRSRAGAVVDILPLAALFLFPVLPLTLLLRAADALQGPKAILALALVLAIVLLIVAGFLMAMRQYRRSRLEGRLVLDREAGSVVIGGEVRCPLSDVRAVEVRRGAEPAGADRWDLVLAREAGAGVVVRGTGDREEMRAHGQQVATFLRVPLQEPA